MAGRPKKMAERVERLEAMSLELLDELWASCPTAYRAEYVTGEVDEDDRELNPVRYYWHESLNATYDAAQLLERLGDLLRRKAGIDRPSPLQQYLPEDEARTSTEPAKSGEVAPAGQ